MVAFPINPGNFNPPDHAKGQCVQRQHIKNYVTDTFIIKKHGMNSSMYGLNEMRYTSCGSHQHDLLSGMLSEEKFGIPEAACKDAFACSLDTISRKWVTSRASLMQKLKNVRQIYIQNRDFGRNNICLTYARL